MTNIVAIKNPIPAASSFLLKYNEETIPKIEAKIATNPKNEMCTCP